ncbi:hypothetical protein IU433_25360 [Nocardia puris]|uniref:Uncharacterized protein n=1 Tax=Nocardia puris TaxID=208602 RepID=A0A366E486_9NOCA|nr:hypothetical protein [Nocardia puris]MBF6214764.1 hypothetical protein [Nocardia puris]MBF6368762.1 hypothetical protein [Nocardia puris]MBF6462342.1 hypothetical protein [Nocardia puris]RBO96925.1 hypothetical protein DFR74_101944 [Nocardia puris]
MAGPRDALNESAESALRRCGSDPVALAGDAAFATAWRRADPSMRAAVLVDLAWRHRHRHVPEVTAAGEIGGVDAPTYARLLRLHAAEFYGSDRPDELSHGMVGGLARMLTWHPDDLELSPATVLLVLSARPAAVA